MQTYNTERNGKNYSIEYKVTSDGVEIKDVFESFEEDGELIENSIEPLSWMQPTLDELHPIDNSDEKDLQDTICKIWNER